MRQYSPAAFGEFAVWFGLVSMAAVIITGRFEVALAIEPDGEPRRKAALATLLTTLLAAVVFLLLIAICAWVGGTWLPAVPPLMLASIAPAALFTATAQTWQSLAAAEGRYFDLSVMRITQAGSVTLLQMLVGIEAPSAASLASAYGAGVLLGIAVAAWRLPISTQCESYRVLLVDFWKRQKRFPMLSLPADAINATTAQLPLLIVASRFGADIAGLLALTLRTLNAPIALMGKAVLDVFKRHAAASWRDRAECRDDYLQTFKVLAAASAVAAICLFFSSETIFGLAFGEKWRKSGEMAVWLLPLFSLRFIASPLSYLFYIAGKQHLDLAWQVMLLLMTTAALALGTTYSASLISYSAGYSLLYLIYLRMSYSFSLGEKNDRDYRL